MRTPKRHQRSRAKGSKLPAEVVCVTRPGKFGNPFPTAKQFRDVLTQVVDGSGDQRVCCGLEEFGKMIDIAKRVEDLRGKDLACWCRVGNPCHADVLIEFANRSMEDTQ